MEWSVPDCVALLLNFLKPCICVYVCVKFKGFAYTTLTLFVFLKLLLARKICLDALAGELTVEPISLPTKLSFHPHYLKKKNKTKQKEM